ncbi:hypothetical protein BGW36DRAFT_288804 [Talaromyces proteolyticus]|uniref:Uncharacterized protein n=1 Tax=Talaromyces proteolyticus TaxID=1131652 RepID=A0AAD4L0L1_9EURO|nr:uncharacterized protein BGW36DRAFT_288804 [Talaromyces proteolyticus]KAH8704039.1 hypothetical protein BGW36DRAFT_288804 [Talaromyces proteolyticus]
MLTPSSLLSMLLSWRTLFILFAYVNKKSLPFGWTASVTWAIVKNLRRNPSQFIFDSNKPVDVKGHPTHPVFAVATMNTYTSLLETDYNIHKSNSTYYADMDISRTHCVTRLYTPGNKIVNKELDEEIAAAAVAEGKPRPTKSQPFFIALGGAYCSFKRELKPLEKYDIKSYMAAWDEKWMYIMTYFIKPEKKRGAGPTIAAIGVSKYCIKKGRLTVPIERVLRASGYLPPRPEGATPVPAVRVSGNASTTGTPKDEGLTSAVDGVKLVDEMSKLGNQDWEMVQKQKTENAGSWNGEEWTWERIEAQRKKGLELIQGYIGLDNRLYDDWNN